MKRFIRSSKTMNPAGKKILASKDLGYTESYKIRVDGVQFHIYGKYMNSADNFQCQIAEIHPYDDAEYAWVRKSSPLDANIYKDGKLYGHMELREWDDEAADEYHDDELKFVNDMVREMCKELRAINKYVKPIKSRD